MTHFYTAFTMYQLKRFCVAVALLGLLWIPVVGCGGKTIQYPEERQTLAEAVRQFPFLVFDGNDPMAGLRCVACQICEKECPPKCIYIEKSKDKKPDYIGKPQLYPATFDIDLSVCMSCQICVEVCPFDAIKPDFTTRTSDCTLCQTCGGVCPTHAIKFVERWNTVELKVLNDPPTHETPLGRRGSRRSRPPRPPARRDAPRPGPASAAAQDR